MKLYVGNLSYETTEGDLRTAFEGFGKVSSVNIVTDKYTGKSRGFGFVEMDSTDEANEAISNLHDSELNGRNLNINEAKPRNDKRGGGGGFRKKRDGYRENW
jgi:RNA recognition motif-containing protein